MPADPNAAVRAYGGAASVGHLEIAEAVCVVWDGPGDAPARFARQAAAKGWTLDPAAGAWMCGDRAVVAAGVVPADVPNPLDLVWVFLSRGDAAAAWRIEAVTRGVQRAGAYLLGWAGPRQRVSELPDGAPPAGDITAVPALRARFEAAQRASPVVVRAQVLPGTTRTLVHLDTSEGAHCWVLDGTVIVAMPALPTWEELLVGVPVPWETFARGPGVTLSETAPISDEARAELSRRVAEMLKPRLEALVGAALTGRDG